MSRVCMGGTFDVLHRGHRALLETAFREGDSGVFIGVTSEALAQRARDRPVRSVQERMRTLKDFLRERGWLARAEVEVIDDPFGRALEPRFDAIVVTPETHATAERINVARAERGLDALRIVVAPLVLAEDGRRISATRVRAGEVDAEGRLTRALRVAVGSDNPVKVEAVRRVVRAYWPDAEVRGLKVDTRVSEQPRDDETWKGAMARAHAALAAWPESDFGVGVEAGLFWVSAIDRHFDVQACAIVDRGNRATFGQGPGFAYPPAVIARVEAEGATIGAAMSDLSGIPGIGRGIGAVGWLTRERLDRAELTESAVLAAVIPRLHPRFYFPETTGTPATKKRD